MLAFPLFKTMLIHGQDIYQLMGPIITDGLIIFRKPLLNSERALGHVERKVSIDDRMVGTGSRSRGSGTFVFLIIRKLSCAASPHDGS